MDSTLALRLVGIIMTLTGIIFNVAPMSLNRVVYGGIRGEAEERASALQVVHGGIGLGLES